MKKRKTGLDVGPEIAVVIGCGQKHEMLLRAAAAAEFALANPDATLIVSGDGRTAGARVSEAAKLRRMLRAEGVEDSRIRMERKANSTIGNAVWVRDMLDGVSPRALYVVTSPFHMRRALLVFTCVFEREWDIQPFPALPAADDARRAEREGDLSLTEKFFQNISPGDLVALKAKLRPNGKPIY